MPKILIAALTLFGLMALAAALTTTARPHPTITHSTSVLPPP